MKKTMYFNMNAPEYSDPIDVKNLSDNFNVIDYGLMTSRCSKSRTTNSINERAVLPYYKIVNDNDFDVVVINRNFDNVETTIKAGEELKVNVSDINRSMNYMVKDLHEVTFEWFITVEDAIKEGGGGSGGTSNYNDLTNKPQINSVTLSGNKTLTDLGITNSSGKIKSDLLPAFVDNYDSYANRAAFPATGVEDRLYLAKDTRLSYVWDSGTSDYVVVGSPLALGESSSTAYRGDRGKEAYEHAKGTHARTDATAVSIPANKNGYININGTDSLVYEHPKATGSSDTNPHGTTASDVGLGNVGNYKAVSTSSQSLSDTEKSTARTNIGAGTSSFSGSYSDLSDVPSTFTPAAHSHAGDGLTVKSTAYSKATAEADITYDKKIDVAIGQLDYRTDVLKQNKVDKTTVSSSISSSKCTIEVPEKAKAVSVCTMKGKTYKTKNLWSLGKVSGTGDIFSGKAFSLPAGTYSIKTVSASNPFNVRLYYTAGSSSDSIVVSVSASSTIFTATKPVVSLNLSAGSNTINTDVMLVSGSTMYDYEPYGELWNASNESVVSVGKNIVDVMSPVSSSKTTLTNVSDGTFTLKTSGAWTAWNMLCDVEVGKTYRINYNLIESTGNYGKLYVRYISDDTNYLDINFNTLGNASNTFTPTENQVSVRIYVNNSTNTGDYMKKFKLAVVPSSESATSYPPYFKHTAEIPISLTSLDGYGCSLTKTDSTTITNVIDFENGIYTQPVGVMKLEDLTWKYRNDGTGFAPYFYTEFGTSVIKVNGTITNQQNVVMGKYPTVGRTSATVFTDKTMCADGGSSGVSQIQIKDSSYTDAETFKKSLSGQILLYEKYTTETKDISDIIRPLKVESGGTVTFVNEHNIDCDTVVKYKKEV